MNTTVTLRLVVVFFLFAFGSALAQTPATNTTCPDVACPNVQPAKKLYGTTFLDNDFSSLPASAESDSSSDVLTRLGNSIKQLPASTEGTLDLGGEYRWRFSRRKQFAWKTHLGSR
ncbi:MAG: hypothetical protein WBD20_13010 [Pirellulaceae bacterium]